MVFYWNFNPLRPDHWSYIYSLWLKGWVVDETSEMMFFITIFAIVPIWLTGWTASCLIPWRNVFFSIFVVPLLYAKNSINKPSEKKPALKKKLSYKKTRPPAVRTKVKKPEAPEPVAAENKPQQTQPIPEIISAKPSIAAEPKETPRSTPAPVQAAPVSKPVASKKASSADAIEDIIKTANYEIISDVKIGNNDIAYLAMAEEQIVLCYVDAEDGDWLADEERFNDEDPLWFSENSHRVSPVRKVIDAKESLIEKISAQGESFEVATIVILSNGTIINAEDMFEIWAELSVGVGRVGSGGPDEIKILEDVLPRNNGEKASSETIAKIKKIIDS